MELSGDTRYFIYHFRNSAFQEMNLQEVEKFIKEGGYVEECVSPPVATLILHVTRKCPLRCKHCYLSASPLYKDEELSLNEIKDILCQFKNMGGLGVDITGGDPLMRSDIKEIVKEASQLQLHVDLLTSGVLIKPSLIQELIPFVHKITLVTYRNLLNLPEIGEMICKLGTSKWSLTLPRLTGRMKSHPEIFYRTIEMYQRDWQKAEEMLEIIYEIASSYNVQILVDFPLLPQLSYGNIKNSSLKSLYLSFQRSILLKKFEKITGSGCLHVHTTLKRR